METVKLKKSELLAHLRTNREKHRSIFLKAQDKYRELAIKELDAMLAEAKAGKKIRRAVNLVSPEDHTRDYDRVIKMVKMSVEDVIEVNEMEFSCYVMNRWDWQNQFVGSISGYASAADLVAYVGEGEPGVDSEPEDEDEDL